MRAKTKKNKNENSKINKLKFMLIVKIMLLVISMFLDISSRILLIPANKLKSLIPTSFVASGLYYILYLVAARCENPIV